MPSFPTPVPSAGEEFAPGALSGEVLERAAAVLRDRGVVRLGPFGGRGNVLSTAGRLMSALWRHRDADPDGLTVIRDTGRHEGQPGFAGLGRGHLALHTECAQLLRPPRLVLLVCAQAADTGGESLLVDGQAVVAELADIRPSALGALSAPRAAYFGGTDGHFAPVLESLPDWRWRLRLRQDSLARFSPEAGAHLPALRRAVERNTLRLPLTAGQGLLLDNHRVLHGRTSFTGERRLLRALGQPDPRLALKPGFPAPPTPSPASAPNEADAPAPVVPRRPGRPDRPSLTH